MTDYLKSELVTLKEALELTKYSVTPGALTYEGKQLVQYDDENNSYIYVPDVQQEKLQIQSSISESQLEHVIRSARYRCWIPAGNFVIM